MHGALVRRGAVAILRRQGIADRQCIAHISTFNPRERPDITNPVDRNAIVSALAPDGTVLTPDPDYQQDRLVTLNSDGTEKETLQIFEPANPTDPAGVVVLWQLSVRK
jgi:hypothetical protein